MEPTNSQELSSAITDAIGALIRLGEKIRYADEPIDAVIACGEPLYGFHGGHDGCELPDGHAGEHNLTWTWTVDNERPVRVEYSWRS